MVFWQNHRSSDCRLRRSYWLLRLRNVHATDTPALARLLVQNPELQHSRSSWIYRPDVILRTQCFLAHPGHVVVFNQYSHSWLADLHYGRRVSSGRDYNGPFVQEDRPCQDTAHCRNCWTMRIRHAHGGNQRAQRRPGNRSTRIWVTL
jgi:hypothetical protein